MTVLRNDNRWDKSNVLFRNGELIEYDKHLRRPDMAHVDFGISVLSSRVFSRYQASRVIDLADVCRDLSLARQNWRAFEVSERFYEIGSLAGHEGRRRIPAADIDPAMNYTQKHLQETAAIAADAGRRRHREDRARRWRR